MKENAEILNTQAIELAARGDFPEAIACFMRALNIEKSNSLIWYNLGVTYRDFGDLGTAKKTLLTAYEFDNTDEEVLETLSLVCFAQNEIDEAFRYCTDALELNPENAHIWNNIGVLYFTRSEYAHACEAFEKAVTLYPYYDDALYNLHDVYVELGNTAGAEDCQRRLSELVKNNKPYA